MFSKFVSYFGRSSYTACVIRASDNGSIWAMGVWRSLVKVVGGPWWKEWSTVVAVQRRSWMDR